MSKTNNKNENNPPPNVNVHQVMGSNMNLDMNRMPQMVQPFPNMYNMYPPHLGYPSMAMNNNTNNENKQNLQTQQPQMMSNPMTNNVFNQFPMHFPMMNPPSNSGSSQSIFPNGMGMMPHMSFSMMPQPILPVLPKNETTTEKKKSPQKEESSSSDDESESDDQKLDLNRDIPARRKKKKSMFDIGDDDVDPIELLSKEIKPNKIDFERILEKEIKPQKGDSPKNQKRTKASRNKGRFNSLNSQTFGETAVNEQRRRNNHHRNNNHRSNNRQHGGRRHRQNHQNNRRQRHYKNSNRPHEKKQDRSSSGYYLDASRYSEEIKSKKPTFESSNSFAALEDL